MSLNVTYFELDESGDRQFLSYVEWYDKRPGSSARAYWASHNGPVNGTEGEEVGIPDDVREALADVILKGRAA